jgi:hypothetical protein
MGKIEN